MMRVSNEESERYLITTVIGFPDAIDDIDLVVEDFFSPTRKVIWRTLLEMRAVGTLGSEDAMTAMVMDAGDFVRHEWLACAGRVAITGNIGFHVDIVREHALTRAVLAATGEIQEMQRQDKAQGTELLSAAQGTLHRLADTTTNESWTMQHMVKRRLRQVQEQVDAYQRGEPVLTGIPTGLGRLDDLLGGYQKGIITGVLGRPSMGKSSLLQAAVAAACAENIGVHVFSLEDRWESFVDRAWSRLSRVPVEDIRRARIATGDWQRFTSAVDQTNTWKSFRYCPTKAVTVEQLVGKIRKERKAIDTQLVVIDYLGLLCRSQGMQRDQDSLNHACDYLSRVAAQEELAIVLACQMNRDAERRPDRRPQLSDAREAGHFEQAAKTMLGLYRPKMYDENRPEDQAEVLVIKNNDGRTGRIKLHWHGPTTTLSDRTDNAEWD